MTGLDRGWGKQPRMAGHLSVMLSNEMSLTLSLNSSYNTSRGISYASYTFFIPLFSAKC